jgi:hypothetical protein
MPGDGDGSITGWIAGGKAGDLEAAQPLWERYFARMVDLVRSRLRASPRRGRDAASDEEDAALSAFDSLCAGLARGRFPQLAERDDLWRLLVVITTRKVRAQARRRLWQKCGGGQVQPACDLDDGQSDDDLSARAVGSEPTPEFAVMVVEEYRKLLDRSGDDVLRRVAILRIEGHTTDAIAGRLGCARRTVARRPALIRRILAADEEAESDPARSLSPIRLERTFPFGTLRDAPHRPPEKDIGSPPGGRVSRRAGNGRSLALRDLRHDERVPEDFTRGKSCSVTPGPMSRVRALGRSSPSIPADCRWPSGRSSRACPC